MITFANIAGVPIVQLAGWALIHSLWQGLGLTALLIAGLWVLRRRSANSRYLLGCATLLALVCCPILTARRMPVYPEPIETAIVDAAAVAAPHADAEPAPVTPSGSTSIVASMSTAQAPEGEPVRWDRRLVAAAQPVLPVVAGLWLCGVLVLSLLRAAGFGRVRKIRRTAAAVTDPNLEGSFAALARQIGISRPVRLLRSTLISVPATLGWLRPVVLLPVTTLTKLDEGQLRAILAHELAHIRRYDYLVNLVQTVIESLLFYHPAAWWISRQIRRERENCCDDIATAACGDRLGYARALVVLENLRHATIPLAVAADGGSLLGRIRRVLGEPSPRDNHLPRWLAGIVTTLVVLGAAVTVGFNVNPVAAESPTSTPAADQATPVTFADDLVFEISVIARPNPAAIKWLGGADSLKPNTYPNSTPSERKRPGPTRILTDKQVAGLLSAAGQSNIRVVRGRVRAGHKAFLAVTEEETATTRRKDSEAVKGPHRTGMVMTLTGAPRDDAKAEMLTIGAHRVRIPRGAGQVQYYTPTEGTISVAAANVKGMVEMNLLNAIKMDFTLPAPTGSNLMVALPLSSPQPFFPTGKATPPTDGVLADVPIVIFRPVRDPAAMAKITARLPLGEGPALGLLVSESESRIVRRTYPIGDFLNNDPKIEGYSSKSVPELLADYVADHLRNPADTKISTKVTGDQWVVITSKANHVTVAEILGSLRANRGRRLRCTLRFIEASAAGDRRTRQWLTQQTGKPASPDGAMAWVVSGNDAEALLERTGSDDALKVTSSPRMTMANYQQGAFATGREVALMFGSGEAAVVAYHFSGQRLALSLGFRGDGTTLSTRINASASTLVDPRPIPTDLFAQFETRVDLPPGKQAIILRMPVGLYRLKLIGSPQSDGKMPSSLFDDHFERTLVDPAAKPSGWVYVVMTLTLPPDSGMF